jgi:excisionase family DNA binding protein
MNVGEAANYLFVSRLHVRRLVERGVLASTVNPAGNYDIDAASVEKYAEHRKVAAENYFESQTEDKDPLGL